MTDRLRVLVSVAVHLATDDREGLETCFAEGLEAGLGEEIEEVLLQSYLYLGYPRAINGLATWRARSGRPPPPPTTDDVDLWAERGERICREVYRGAYVRLRTRVRDIHPDLDRWMVSEGYGKVLGRPALDLVDRELTIAAALIGLGAPKQLFSHLMGALNVGASMDVVQSVVDHSIDLVDPRRAAEARGIWSDVRDRRLTATADLESNQGRT